MTPTTLSSAPASTAGFLRPDLLYGQVCAIHQPNLFLRLATLAKLFSAVYWIVRDGTQFARRDYQHRTPLPPLDAPGNRSGYDARSTSTGSTSGHTCRGTT